MAIKEPSAAELRRKSRERFAMATRLEAEYLRSLRQLTKQIDHIIKGLAGSRNFSPYTQSQEIQAVLHKYSLTIEPWAKSIVDKMLYRIAKKDETAWIQLGKEMGKSLKKELDSAPTGEALRTFMTEQVHLITSLPIEAAERVHKMTLEGITNGTRASEISANIMATGKVIESRAKLIARTEVARTAAGLTMARATHVGVTHYIWRTSGDADVRESHKKMNGKIIPFAEMPEVEPGHKYHAGMFPNCRCYIEPILTED